jgi:phosphate transport system substrate-binding protein
VKLPHQPIVPVRRSDGSGDTYIFTQFLSFADATWSDSRAFGMTINWPVVPGSLEAAGIEGMVQTIQKTPYSIGYIGVSYSKEIADAGLGTALLKNQAGNFLLPTKETVEAAAEGLGVGRPRTSASQSCWRQAPTLTRSSIMNMRWFQPSCQTQT